MLATEQKQHKKAEGLEMSTTADGMQAIWGQITPEPESPNYDDYPTWLALLVEPNRENLAAERLKKSKIVHYLPRFQQRVLRRGHAHQHVARAVIPGMLFAPVPMYDALKAPGLFKFAHLRSFLAGTAGSLAHLRLRDIETVRTIEQKLQEPPPRPNGQCSFRVDQPIKFVNNLYADFGEGVVIEVANDRRIRIRVKQLFGCEREIWIAASEIEAL
jgi:hypothetical protein